MAKKKNSKLAFIGGGHGVSNLLVGFKDYFSNISAIISMVDSGGSTGRLRRDYDVLPPGDIRRALIALSSAPQPVKDFFDFRFDSGELKSHNVGNILLSALEINTGSFEKGLETINTILKPQGDVVPVTLTKTNLYARLENGETIIGETNIDVPKHNPNLKIEKLFLDPPAKANPKAIQKIMEAEYIFIGPGDLYSSILPNLIVAGIPEALQKTAAKKIYVCNVMTKIGETKGFKVSDFVAKITEGLGGDYLDYVIFQQKVPPKGRIDQYIKSSELLSDFVYSDIDKMPSNGRVKYIGADIIPNRGGLYHDARKVVSVFKKYILK